MKQFAHVALLMSLAQLFDSAGLVKSYATIKHIVHEVVHSRADSTRRVGRHRTLVADLADDVSFAGRDPSLLDNKEEFNVACSLFVGQAGDLGCLLQVSQQYQAAHLCHLVPEATQQMPSAHWGDYGPELNWADTDDQLPSRG